jgi:hypothetical protein
MPVWLRNCEHIHSTRHLLDDSYVSATALKPVGKYRQWVIVDCRPTVSTQSAVSFPTSVEISLSLARDLTSETPYIPSGASKSTDASVIRLRTAVGYFAPTPPCLLGDALRHSLAQENAAMRAAKSLTTTPNERVQFVCF